MSSTSNRKVLLVGWDAADWKVIHPLMDDGKMPTVKRLVESGAMANLATLHPVLSPMLWTSIATGKRPHKHGICGFCEPAPDGSGVRPVTNLSRKTKAIWNILTQNRLTSNVVGWWPSHPAEPIRGVMVSNHYHRAVGPPEQPWPMLRGSVHPSRLMQTFAELRLNPNELLVEHILPFVPRAAQIDQDKDRRLALVAKILAECTSVHSVATWLIENEPWDLMAVYYDAIDHFSHGFMRYHPPRQSHIDEQDFELYRGVVEASYCYHDMMLHRLMQLAGDDTTVILISDHGFHPDHLRPKLIPAEPAGPAVEHRDFGIFVMSGPGIRRDVLLHGMNLLDIAPTLLALFGLPVGEDMDGQVTAEAFELPLPINSIPSWDEVPGDTGMHPADARLDPVESQEAIQQLVALGYIEPPDADCQQAISKAARELRYHLARSYMDDNRHGDAVEILERLYSDWPNEHRFGIHLAMCYQATERIADLRTLVDDLSTRRRDDAAEATRQLRELIREVRQRRQSKRVENSSDVVQDRDHRAARGGLQLTTQERRRIRELRARARYNPFALSYLQGYVHLAEGKSEEALQCLHQAEQAHVDRPGLHIQIGEAYLQLKQCEDAERSFQKAIDIDVENAHAWLGVARSQLLRRQNRRAVDTSLKAIGLLYHYPLAHYTLGIALHRTGRIDQAREAFGVAVSLNPNFAEAHQRLAYLYQRRFHLPQKADEHRQLARQMRQAQHRARAAESKYRVRVAREPEAAEPEAKETR